MQTENEPTGSNAAGLGAASSRLDLRDVFYVLGLIFLTVAALRYTRDLLVPIVFAILLWFLINALSESLRRIPAIGPALPHGLALTIAAGITLMLCYSVGQLVFDNISELSSGLRQFGPKADEALGALESVIGVPITFKVSPLINDLKISDLPLYEWLPELSKALTATASNLLLVVLYAAFLMFDQPHYQAKLQALFPDDGRFDRAKEVLQRIGADTRLYIRIMTMVSLGVGLFTYGLASWFNVDGAAFWGFLAFALNYIPTVGSMLGVLLPGAFALVQLDNPSDVGLFVAALAIVQLVAGNIILPRIAGDQLNLSQFVVILSLSVFGALWGVAGLFLAVPVVMVLVIVLSQFDSTRPFAILLSKRGQVIRN